VLGQGVDVEVHVLLGQFAEAAGVRRRFLLVQDVRALIVVLLPNHGLAAVAAMPPPGLAATSVARGRATM
jgi:hypothetical protein